MSRANLFLPAQREQTRTRIANHDEQTVLFWGEVIGDPTVASAMIDRIVHHADLISIKGTGCRFKSRQPTPDTA
ncbi:ATP-binding protein [Cryobacterium sp. Y11]|uniref:ATP-binding protein n=1 Tax=Cryobacterium sp. Y11 TaxID=2045016 RepID=UPI003511A9E3